jgi:hypothetical protein
MKTQDQNMHTEHGTSPTDNPATGLVIGAEVDREAIAVLAYSYWKARGGPHDSPLEDWYRAEADLRNRLTDGPAD